MYRYQPTKIVELDDAVRACVKAQQRMERASLGLVRDALARIARAQRPIAGEAAMDSMPAERDAPAAARQ